MPPKLDLTNKRYGKLTVIKPASIQVDKRPGWVCLCDCGNYTLANSGQLNYGNIKSCGCLVVDRSTVHGMYNTPEYHTWNGLIKRCENKNDKDYIRYGARGVKVCDKWRESFAAFYRHMGKKPTLKHQIDRIDNNGNYTPKNCRWVLPNINARNRRNSKWWYIQGKIFNSAKEAAAKCGVSDTTITFWCQGRKNKGRNQGPKQFCFSVGKYDQTTI